jgi:hypothetical protein
LEGTARLATTFSPVSFIAVAPVGAVSALVGSYSVKVEAGGSLFVHFDDVFFRGTQLIQTADPSAIPTLEGAGLVALALGIGLGALLVLRRLR